MNKRHVTRDQACAKGYKRGQVRTDHDRLLTAVLLERLHAHGNLHRAAAGVNNLTAEAHIAHGVEWREHVESAER